MRLTTPRRHRRAGAPTPPRITTDLHRARVGRRASRLASRAVLLAGAAITMLLAAASAAYAEQVQVVALAGSINDVLTNIRNLLMSILIGLTIVFATLGGIKWVMATDPGEAEKAKSALKNAGIGLILTALAPVLVEALRVVVGA